ncbi:MAG TPA: hydrolase [Eubacteriaceae bacterium]|nr:hydrolase [Eubacteriaceae bacterium]
MYIQHTSHSGFMVFDGKFVLLFDCMNDIDIEKIKNKEIVFFASHHHKDHYNEQLATELSKYRTTYILSNDIEDSIPQKDLTCIMSPYQEVTLGPLHVRTYSSTDRGVSFFVELFGKRYFHSGDLNWWHWEHMDPSQLMQEESDFKTEIEKIRSLDIDFAFVPVDPRLKEHGILAVNYFEKTVQPRFIIPMHSFGEYSYYSDAKKRISFDSNKWIDCNQENQIIWKD